MQTIHTTDNREFRTAVENAVCRAGINSYYKRVMVCGKGVVILPDTNRNHDCEMPELLKALHLKDKAEPISSGASATEERQDVIMCYGDDIIPVRLTPDQLRLLDWLSENDFLEYQWKILGAGEEI